MIVGLVIGGLLAASGVTGYAIVREVAALVTRARALEQPGRPGSAAWVNGLIGVTEDGALVTPRGVELPFCDAWEFEDVMSTVADVEALG